ncbi:methyltransferase domain-containing protein [Trichlorobacter lovleyi]|uniref:methyltransferase domain-containing protein n=1 Tax=Trichlorobacter lovleyi TaxID=313985 RepID=UPI003D0EFBAD
MPKLDTKLHLDMLQNSKKENKFDVNSEVYGLHWGDPETVPPLKYVRDSFLLPYITTSSTVLEIGVGGGRWTRYMLKAKHLYAVDYHVELLEELKLNYNYDNMSFVLNNGYDFPGVLNQSVDFIFSFGTFVHLDVDIIKKYLINIKSILKETSNVVIQYSDMRKPMARALKGSFSENDPDIMKKLVKSCGFEIYEDDDQTLWHSAIIRFGLVSKSMIYVNNLFYKEQPNILLLTYDSCRYDTLKVANTPVLDSFVDIVSAQAPANFTYPSHCAFFCGILPNSSLNQPYINRFNRQLFGISDVGETNVVKKSYLKIQSNSNFVDGLRGAGYQTIGCGAMNWFRQETLTYCFEDYLYTGTDADSQIDFLLANLDPSRKFFGFINFGETHAPFFYKGKKDTCPVDVRARIIKWPPCESPGPVGQANEAFRHQVEAAEFLDSRLARLFSSVPSNTIVVLCADHGECFGEDGYWGHGFNHPKVLEVPLAIFRLDGKLI